MSNDIQPAGYLALVNRYSLSVIPHYRESYVTPRGQRRVDICNGIEHVVYPKSYIPKETLVGQLEFALKYDGINLEILKAIFQACKITELREYILNHPTSKYARKIWYLYEYLLDTHLSIPDVGKGNYIDLIDSKKYFTCKAIKSSRHRVNNNLLGDCDFSPMVRRTVVIESFIEKNLNAQVKDIVKQYPENIVTRASQYLYRKETKSLLEMECEKPSQNRVNRFIDMIRQTELAMILDKNKLIELQNMIVDSRFAEMDYSASQNYVGEMLGDYRENIRYIAPRPNDISSLMKGLLNNIERMKVSNVDFVVQAAVAAFSFVFIHPFGDGNGRLHRLLINHVLIRTGFTPENIIFPVSAIMHADLKGYNTCLEVYSKQLMPLMQYHMKKNGVLIVDNETADHYRYYDATIFVEYLFSVIEKTIQENFIDELEFVVAYGKAKNDIQDLVDMPDKMIDLFVKICICNNYKMPKAKYERFFNKLSGQEIQKMEVIVHDSFTKELIA